MSYYCEDNIGINMALYSFHLEYIDSFKRHGHTSSINCFDDITLPSIEWKAETWSNESVTEASYAKIWGENVPRGMLQNRKFPQILPFSLILEHPAK